MAKKKKKMSEHITEEEMVQGAEDAGLLEHNEAEEILEEDKKFDEVGMDDESDVKRPELTGKKKPVKTKFEQPGTNNQSREVIEEDEQNNEPA